MVGGVFIILCQPIFIAWYVPESVLGSRIRVPALIVPSMKSS